MSYHEETFNIQGQKIAAVVHNEQSGIPTIAIHGWLDNAASFQNLAPLLPELNIVALDLPGHGFSDHIPPSGVIHVIDFCVSVIQVAQHLGWKQFALLGHSLGAAICSMIASAISDRILFVSLIDGLGPLSAPSDFAANQFKLFVNDLLSKPHRRSPSYESLEDAINTRLKVNKMERESMAILVQRGLKQQDNKWIWRTDPRLLMPSPVQFTERQVHSFLESISCPIGIIRPNPGYPFPMDIVEKRLNTIKQIQISTVEGHHHVHLDSPKIVANAIHAFLKSIGQL